MSKISFIYFDVGGVVIKDFSDTNKWLEMKNRIGITSDRHEEFDRIWQEYRGQIAIDFDVDNFTQIIKKELKIQIPEAYSMLQDFVDNFEQNSLIWPLLGKLKQKNKIGLLTNMYPRMFEGISQKGLLPPTEWNVIIDSSVVKLQKPDKEIYLHAQKMTGVPHEEILFIDNQQKNLDAAKELGWQTFLYDSRDYEQATRALSKFLGL